MLHIGLTARNPAINVGTCCNHLTEDAGTLAASVHLPAARPARSHIFRRLFLIFRFFVVIISRASGARVLYVPDRRTIGAAIRLKSGHAGRAQLLHRRRLGFVQNRLMLCGEFQTRRKERCAASYYSASFFESRCPARQLFGERDGGQARLFGDDSRPHAVMTSRTPDDKFGTAGRGLHALAPGLT